MKDVASSHKQPPGSAGSIAPPSPAGSTHPASSASSQHGQSTPAHQGGGTLTIRIIEAKGLSVPAGTNIPDEIQRAIAENPQVGSLTVGSLTNGTASTTNRRSNRESVQRKQSWWLPCTFLPH